MAAHGKGATRFGQMLYLWRTVHRFTLRDIAAETGISNVTLMRIEHGHMMDAETWLKLESWMFARIGPAPRLASEATK